MFRLTKPTHPIRIGPVNRACGSVILVEHKIANGPNVDESVAISRQGFTDFPGQQVQLSPTGLCMNYKGEVPEYRVSGNFALAIQSDTTNQLSF
jgi:hypothetical protein